MYYGDTLLVNLDTGTTEQFSFDEVGVFGPGLAAGIGLYEKYGDADPLVIGSGLLTGTTAPASCLGFVVGKSPLTGEVAVSPLGLYAGAEVKLSGFAMIVIRGTSDKPVYLWLHDGVADIQDASALWGRDNWETTDAIRQEMGEGLIQVISAGPACEEGSRLASFSIDYWGSGDTAGLGAAMGARKLKAVALRGLGMLDPEDPEAYYEATMEMLAGSPAEPGFGRLSKGLGAGDVDGWLKPMVHRYRSCFACPAACNTFVKYNEPASVLAPDGVDEPGVMVTSAAAALWLMGGGWEAEPACRAMEAMARAGIDQVRGARELAEKPLKDPAGVAAAVSALTGSAAAGWPSSDRVGSGLFGPWVPPLGSPDEWMEAHRLGYLLGICPTYLLTSGIDRGALLGLCGPASGVELDTGRIAEMLP
ncbi:MAG: hypothetical protein KKF41_00290 [Actinobacteria bacterium]|nr:hypothetical protein [Actinomycetota bacterium]MBU1942684.1 hypothetical protein [Actinomycetota bacterium]MBU2686006.1 hypothetical protein [Actinomycetota bacterium]